MDIFNNFENDIINNLKETGLIKRFSSNEFNQSPDLELIIKLFEEPVEIFYDDQGIYFFDGNGDKTYCPKMQSSISESGSWLSDRIPEISFDIDQSGNVRKANESEALFCSVVTANVLKEDIFKEEVLEVAKNYDFENMKSKDENGKLFRELLNEWQNLQSVIINILISACRYRIFDEKKDVEKFLKDGLSEQEVAELRNLQIIIRNINLKYSEGSLSPSNIRNLTKIERLGFITKRDDEISKEIQNSKAGVLFKILNLSSEYISPINKKKILIWIRNEVTSYINENLQNSNLNLERAQIINRLQKRAVKLEKNSVRRINVEKYIQDKENFSFPPKL